MVRLRKFRVGQVRLGRITKVREGWEGVGRVWHHGGVRMAPRRGENGTMAGRECHPPSQHQDDLADLV